MNKRRTFLESKKHTWNIVDGATNACDTENNIHRLHSAEKVDANIHLVEKKCLSTSILMHFMQNGDVNERKICMHWRKMNATYIFSAIYAE